MKWNIVHFDTLESTNKTALTLPPDTVVIASCQTGGRGRYGRVWESPRGNLYLSAVVRDFHERTPLLAFVAGVAAAAALEEFSVALKWPNDILLDGKKLAGILLERGEGKIIIGIGINAACAPTQRVLYPTASLAGKCSLPELTARVLEQLEKQLDLFQTKGFEPIRKQWVRFAAGIGQPLSVKLPDKQLTGIFRALGQTGALLLELPDGSVQEIAAGDVFLL